jgi:uncharacterized protein (TIGR02147 family)
MIIFDETNYKIWVNSRVKAMPKGGRGQYTSIAQYLSTSTSIVTQVFKGDRDLTPEQAVLLSEYFGLTKLEREYLILLVNYSRAGTHRYKEILKDQIEEQQQYSKEIKSYVAQNIEINEEKKSVLYSNWYYLAIWSLTAIEGYDSIDAIADRLKINRSKANEALQFLLKIGMVIDQGGKLKVGPTLIHLESSSPHIPRHHQNWRLRAFQKYENSKATDVFYTAPVTLSEKDIKMIRERIVKFIADTIDVVKASPSEKLYCMCMDWFEV